eukprot:GHVS01081056.1.p1 GENE.GHVS01081056.1~~GHVS01081056.1.p1  ORF type:complete len:458 (+),score=78.51 GHVS01081056.1:276-1649(+)
MNNTSAAAISPPPSFSSHSSHTSSPSMTCSVHSCSGHLISLRNDNKRPPPPCSSSTPSTSLSSTHRVSGVDDVVEGVRVGEGGGGGGLSQVEAIGVVIDESRVGGECCKNNAGKVWRLPSFLYHAKKAQTTFYGSTDYLPTHNESSCQSSHLSTTTSPVFTFGNLKGFNWLSKFIGSSSAHKRPQTNTWNVIAGTVDEREQIVVNQFCSVVVDNKEEAGCRDNQQQDDNITGIGGGDNMETLPILGSSRCINNNNTVDSNHTNGMVIFNDSSSSCSGGAGSRFSVMSVSVPNHLTPSLCIALLYSFMPYIATNISLVLMLLCSTALAYSLIYVLSMCFLVAFLSEAILKNLLRHPRPLPSSVPSFGMPSAHSSTSIAALTWWLLELRGPDGGPWMLFAEMGQSARLGVACLFILVFLPVPWARYWLRDHSISQCLVGGCLGVLCGILGYVIRLSFFS